MNLPELSATAAALAAAGLPVFPCRQDNKAPCTPRGFKDAVTDSDRAHKLFLSCRSAGLIGVPTGIVSGLSVVDVDPQGFGWMSQNLRRLTPTRIHQTRRGYHLVYQTPQTPLHNSQSLLSYKVDIRGEGGYVIWWPASGLPVRDITDPAAFPKWIIRTLERRAKENAKKKIFALEAGHGSTDDSKALERFVQRLTLGQRNGGTFWAACRAGEVGLISAENALIQAAMATGLDATEATRTVKSGLARGARDGNRSPR